jgi:hypothetical protein
MRNLAVIKTSGPMKTINILAFVVKVVMNYLANALPINGKTTGELSAQYPNLFVPAGITFSIWGIIYLLLMVVLVLQFRSQSQSAVAAIGWAFAISSLLNATWIVAWHYEKLFVSLIIILGMLLALAYINWQLRAMPFGLFKAAFGIYFGWVCIATIANVTALLVDSHWGGWGISSQGWAIAMIATGLIITALALYRVQNPYLGLAVVWAFAGIVIRQAGDNTSIAISAGLAALLMAILVLYVFVGGLRLS